MATQQSHGAGRTIQCFGEQLHERLVRCGIHRRRCHFDFQFVSCRSDDFKFSVQAMDQITTPDNEKMVQGTLSLKRDPMLGSCGT